MSDTLHALIAFAQIWRAEFLCALLLVLGVPLLVGYIVVIERRVEAEMQARLGPMRVVPRGLLRGVVEACQGLGWKETFPASADQFFFRLAALVPLMAALIALGAIAFGPWFQVARDINVGLLFVVGFCALQPFGLLLGGRGTPPVDAIREFSRGAARQISYSLTAGLALVSGLLLAGTLNVRSIVGEQRADQAWYVFLAPCGFFLYLIASNSAYDRAAVDVQGSGAEITADGVDDRREVRRPLQLLADYANGIVVASVATTLFLGGWSRPFPNVHWLVWLDGAPVLLFVAAGAYSVFRAVKQTVRGESLKMWAIAVACFSVGMIFRLAAPLSFAPLRSFYEGLYGAFWFLAKMGAYFYLSQWLRFLLPRLRFDQHMRFAWQILTPLAVVNVIGVAVSLALQSELGWNCWLGALIIALAELGLGLLLVKWNEKHAAAASAKLFANPAGAEDIYAG
jgi:NADH-quinone oxidoreductase subunit H